MAIRRWVKVWAADGLEQVHALVLAVSDRMIGLRLGGLAVDGCAELWEETDGYSSAPATACWSLDGGRRWRARWPVAGPTGQRWPAVS
ncbi:hypothetical protein [Dactylosporangium sp. CA-233914]|uniref:hypothetical protein n=1 Tax=Dactylosporangium sp. CA-233914 TaxID=3239934 RepID=UPI003D8EF9BA